MNKILTVSATIFAVIAVMTSCQKEEGEVVSVNIPYSFSVNSEVKVKTTLKSDDSVEFEENDEISVMTASTNDKFVTENGGATAEFSGNLTAEESVYSVVYPYAASNAIVSGKVSCKIPTMQAATMNSFAPGAAVAVGTLVKESASATLYNATSILELGISRDDIVAVSFASKAGEMLSGDCEISISETPSVVANGATSSSLVTEYGSLLSSGTYDLAIAPATLSNGFDLTFYKKGEGDTYQYGTVSYANSIEFKRNTIKPLGTKDDDIEAWSISYDFVNADKTADVLADASQTKTITAWFVPVDTKSVGFEYKVNEGAWTSVAGVQNANHITAELNVSETGKYTYKAWIMVGDSKIYSPELAFYAYISSDASIYTESFVDDLQNPTAKAWPFTETQPKNFQEGTFTSTVNSLQYTFFTHGTFSFHAAQGLVLKSPTAGDYIEVPAITGKTLKAIAIVRGNSNGCHMKVTDTDGVDLVEDRQLAGIEGEYQVFLTNTKDKSRLVFNSANTFNIRAIILCYESGSITINPEGTTSSILGDKTEAKVNFTTKSGWTAALKTAVAGVSVAQTSGPAGNNEITVNFAENTDPTKNVKATVVITSGGETAEVEISQSSYIMAYFGDGSTFISSEVYAESFSSPAYNDLKTGISKTGEEIEFKHVDGYSYFVKMISGTTVTAKVSTNGKGLAMTGDAGSYVRIPSFAGRKVLRIESNDYSTGKYKKITDEDGAIISGGESAKGAYDLSWDLNQTKVEAGASYRWTFHSGNMTTYLRSLKIHYTD